MNARIVKDTNEEYHAVRAVSNSMLKAYKKNPFLCGLRYWSDIEMPQVEKQAFIDGDAVHAAVLEPERFEQDFVIKPEFSLNTKQGREWKEDNADKHIIDPMPFLEQKIILENSPFAKFFKPENCEISIYWEREGIPCKARIDCYDPDSGTIIDLKTTSAKTEQEFLGHCVAFDYDMQDWWYTSALSNQPKMLAPSEFIFLAITKSSPVDLFYQVLPGELKSRGMDNCETLFQQVKHSIENNHWPIKQSTATLEDLKPWERI